jgi:hypothetical protein
MDAPQTSPLPPPGSSPRILLVDSVIPILRALASMVDPYVIEMATSGALALDRLASLPTIVRPGAQVTLLTGTPGDT